MTTPITTFYVSGPANVWTGTTSYNWAGSPPGPTAWNYIGYTQRGMQIEITPHFEDVAVDYAGGVPGDIQMLGAEARGSGIFTRYNEPLVQNLASFLNKATPTPGELANQDIGSLLKTEGYLYPILIYSPYGIKAAYSMAGSAMVPGFLFYSGYLVNPYSVNLSIRPKTPTLGFRGFPHSDILFLLLSLRMGRRGRLHLMRQCCTRTPCHLRCRHPLDSSRCRTHECLLNSSYLVRLMSGLVAAHTIGSV